MQKINIEPGMIPSAPDGRILAQRLGALVGQKSYSVHRFSGNSEVTAAHNQTFDLVTRFAKEDMHGRQVYSQRGAFEPGVPWMVLSNQPVPSEFGEPGYTPYHPDVAIFIHSDKVGVQNESQHSLRIDGDRAIGRATLDMGAAFIPAIKALSEAPKDLNVAIIAYPDEEIGGHTFSHLVNSGLNPKIAMQFDGEPVPEGFSNISFVTASKAGARFFVRLPGGEPLPSAHASRPHLEESALEDRVMPFIHEVRRPLSRGGAGIPRHTRRVPLATTLVLKPFESSDTNPATTNYDMRLHGDMRAASSKQVEKDLARVAAAAERHGLEVTDPYLVYPEYIQSPHAPEVVLYRALGKAVMHKPMAVRRDTGGNDLAKLPNSTTILSGWRGAGSHGPDEWVSIQAIKDAAQIQGAYAQHLPHLVR